MNTKSTKTVAIVTGGASGIGLASAHAFAAQGSAVIIADINDEAGVTAVESIRQAGGSAEFVRCAVEDPEQQAELFARIRRDYGRLDFAHNNAGVEQARASIIDCTLESWQRTLDINLTGIWLSLKHELDLMREAGHGAIVNTSSMVGHTAAAGAAAYVSSKHAIIGLTRAAALEAAPFGVRVNSISPGHILTPMVARVVEREPAKGERYTTRTPLGRLGTADEVAEAAVWLCGEGARFITGTDLGVDGGVHLS